MKHLTSRKSGTAFIIQNKICQHALIRKVTILGFVLAARLEHTARFFMHCWGGKIKCFDAYGHYGTLICNYSAMT